MIASVPSRLLFAASLLAAAFSSSASANAQTAAPTRVAIVNSRMSLVKIFPRRASVAAFLCLIVAHFECPDMNKPSKPSQGIVAGVCTPLLRR